jgi:hypothetical protein
VLVSCSTAFASAGVNVLAAAELLSGKKVGPAVAIGGESTPLSGLFSTTRGQKPSSASIHLDLALRITDSMARGNSIVWRTSIAKAPSTLSNSPNVSGTADQGDSIVWGTSDSGDSIVWGTSDTGDSIVWGTSDEADSIVWGTADNGDSIVWGTADNSDSIVWGTSDGADSIVWGTSDDGDSIVWGTSTHIIS